MLVTGADGTGDFINDGTVNFFASGTLAAGTYRPISVGGIFDDPDGAYKGIGGTWDGTTHEFVVSAITDVAPTDLSGARVMNFDLIEIDGGLILTGVSSGSYVLDITSLTAGNMAGNVANFGQSDQSWTLLTTTTGITGFDASSWDLNTRNFASDPAWGGSFSLAQVDNNLQLTYTVPEPSMVALVLLSLGALLRRRRSPGSGCVPAAESNPIPRSG